MNAKVFYRDGGGGSIFACEVWLKKKKGWAGKTVPDYCGLCLKFASLTRGEKRYSLKFVPNGLKGSKNISVYVAMPYCQKDTVAICSVLRRLNIFIFFLQKQTSVFNMILGMKESHLL